MHQFSELLKQATGRIPGEYFQLPIDGREDPIYRERVYCYELYHQLRTIWPENTEYSLGGEVDKSGHPLIRGNGLDNSKPDFLVHAPGDMGGNYALLEVKPITAVRAAIRKDIATLSNFLEHAQYHKGIYLFYGRPEDGHGTEIAQEEVENVVRDELEIWLHRAPGDPARRLK